MRSARRATVLGALLGLLAAGCQGSSFARRPPADAGAADVLLAVPLVEQDGRWECGMVSLESLCAYYGVPVPERVANELGERAERGGGLRGADLCRAAEQIGFEAYLFAGTLDRTTAGVLRHLDAGRPLFVLSREGDESSHYALLLGYDEGRRVLYLVDPRRGWVARTWSDFDAAWSETGRVTLLAVPPPEHPSWARQLSRGAASPIQAEGESS